MPKRGSVQLLLLSLRPRAMLGLGLGAAVVILLAGVALFRDGMPFLDKAGIAQALRQTAWQQALSGQSKSARWPWEDLTVSMSLAPGTVPRLGVSASVLKQFAESPVPSPEPRETDHADAAESAAALGDVVISDVAAGDSITFTAADGATCVYRITGRPVVDPHLSEAEATSSDGARLLFNCGPLDRLIMEATQEAQERQPMVPVTGEDQQKL